MIPPKAVSNAPKSTSVTPKLLPPVEQVKPEKAVDRVVERMLEQVELERELQAVVAAAEARRKTARSSARRIS